MLNDCQVTKLTGSKNGIKIQVFWIEGRILSSAPLGGMRTEDGQQGQGGSENIRLQRPTWNDELALGLRCAIYNMVPGALCGGSEVGPRDGFCAGRTFPGHSLFLPHEHNRLFPSSGDIRSSHQHLKQYFCYPVYLVIAWTQHMWGWSLGSCSLVASVISAARSGGGWQEKPP